MRFNTRLSIIAIMAMLFMVSTVSAGIMNFLGMKKKGPERRYYGQLLDVRGAFGIKDLKITKVPEELGIVDYLEGKLGNSDVTITCMEPGTKEEKTIREAYQHVEMNNIVSKRNSKSPFYFASTEFEVKAFRKQCIVSRGVCRWYYSSKKSTQLSNTYMWKYLLWRVKAAVTSIEQALKQIWGIGYTYNFKVDDICYDSHNRMLLNRYENAIFLKDHNDNSLATYDANLYRIFNAVCLTLNRIKGLRTNCGAVAVEWLRDHSNFKAYKKREFYVPSLPLYETAISTTPLFEDPPPYVRRTNRPSN